MDDLLNPEGRWLTDIMGDSAVRRHPELPWWRTRRGLLAAGDYEDRKRRVLSAVLHSFPKVFIRHGADPGDHALGDGWVRIGRTTWQVPGDVDAVAVYRWLRLGNWLLYVADEPLDPEESELLDFRTPAAFVSSMRAASITLAVTAFYENDPWYIGINVGGPASE
jgi:hypothetical protein